VDHDFPGGVKRIMWGYSKSRVNGTAPVDNVDSPDIACRFNPLIPPALTAPARAGSNITFGWTEWFASHKGPVLTVSFDAFIQTRKPVTLTLSYTVHGIHAFGGYICESGRLFQD
jgi:hypothetical protein